MTEAEINEWVAKVGPAPDDVFAKIVARFKSAMTHPPTDPNISD